MPQVDFSNYPYYPALQTNVTGLLAYSQLSNDAKDRLLPLFELAQRGHSTTLDDCLINLRASVGERPFILDLSKEAAPPPYRYAGEDPAKVARDLAAQAAYNEHLSGLLRPDGGFSTWRDLVATFPNAIPALQFTDAATQARQILRQAALLSHGDQSLAVRVTSESAPAFITIIPQIISVLRSPLQLIIIIDCGQRRQRLSQRAQMAAETLLSIRAELDISEQAEMHAVCMSSWYSRPTDPGVQTYEGQDWQLWREARESFPFYFGDYGSMFRLRRSSTFQPSDWVATVSIPLDEGWRTYKHEMRMIRRAG